ncbi:hypothetical protein FJT64_016689 [Amphibalanus amphitrite]|uniref:Uncharacterized protein n=1 Tax=Amphibalanus amphitrite TaxID=1232801 RepID=A0A6A4XBK7_AMPAM|nr:hypothetical protein FJT64_016689 [Amphibalanus amphitrite]
MATDLEKDLYIEMMMAESWKEIFGLEGVSARLVEYRGVRLPAGALGGDDGGCLSEGCGAACSPPGAAFSPPGAAFSPPGAAFSPPGAAFSPPGAGLLVFILAVS